MIKYLLIISLLCWNTGCLFTGKEIAWGLGGIAYVSKEILDRKHEKIKIEQTKRELDLTAKGIELNEKIFEKSKENN